MDFFQFGKNPEILNSKVNHNTVHFTQIRTYFTTLALTQRLLLIPHFKKLIIPRLLFNIPVGKVYFLGNITLVANFTIII